MSPLESAKSPAPEVRRALVRYRRRRRRAAALRGLGITLTATLLSLFASLVLDRFWILGTELRVGLTALTLSVGGLLALALVLWPLLRPLSRRSLARAVERLRPELEGALLSVVELHDGDERDRRRCSRVLLERLVDSTDERAARLDVGELVDRRPSRRALAAAALALLPLGGFVASDAEGVAQLARRFLQPSLDLPRPTSVVLEVLPGDCFVRREDDVELTVRWLRGEPRAVTLLEKREGDAWRRTTVDARGAASPIFRLEDVTSPVVYRVRAGDFESPLYRVTPREPPRPVSFHITYRFPAYSGLVERRVESPTGDLSALAGSVAEVAVSIDRDIARASFRVGDGERRPATVAGRRVTLGEIPIERDGAYRLELEDREGVRSDSLAEYAIRSERDAPPRVEILQPREAEIPVEPTSRLEILYRAEDDLGLAAIDWVSEGDEPRIVPLEVRETGRGERHLLEDTWVLNTAPLGLRPGSTLTFHLRARDFHGQEARSAPRTLRVRFLPPPPEGKDWLARLGGISRDLELLERLWTDLAPPAPPGDSVVGAGRGGFTAARFGDAMDRAAAWRARAQHAGERARDLAMSLGPPGVERETLLALEFHLWNIGSDEARRFWNLAARVAAELESQDEEARWAAARIAEDLRDVHRSAAQRIAELRSGWEVIRSAERLEEDVEAARVLTLDARRLAEAAREPGGPGERAGATIEGPLESLIEESARIYADLALLAEESPDDTPLAALARAIQSTLLAELDEARRAAATGDHQVLASRLEELRRGFGRRLPDLKRELEKARGAARRVRSELDPRPSPAKRVETIAGELRAAASSEARVPTSSTTGMVRVVLDESRRALAEIAFLLGRAEAFSYDDFESAISLEALRDLLGRAAEESLEALVQPGDGDGRTEVLAGRAAFLDELARHFRRTGPLRQLGRAVQLVDGLAEAAESIVWTLRGARAWNPRELGRIARRTRDVAEGVDAARAELRAHLAMAGDAPWKGQLAKSLDGLRESESALESSVRSLVGTSLAPGPALDAARREASRAARLLGDASRAIEELRTDSLAEARAALGWLEERLGDPPQRIARLASAQRELAERAAATPAARRQEIAALAVTQAAHRLEASGLGRELQRLARRAPVSAASGGAESLERGARRLREISRGALRDAHLALRRAADEGTPDALETAAHRAREGADELQSLADALRLAADQELRILTGSELETLLERAGEASAAEEPDAEEIAVRARLLLDAAAKGARILATRLPDGPLRDELLEHLGSAAASFQASLERAEGDDAPGAARALQQGLARFRRAIELARRLRGEALDALASEDRAEAGSERPAKSPELEEAERELASLSKLRSAQKEIEALLEALLGKEDESDFEKALEAQRRLEKAIESETMTGADLLKLVASLSEIDQEGQRIGEAERFLEEKARSLDGAGRRFSPDEATEQEDLLERAREMTGRYGRAGSKITLLFPRLWRAFRQGITEGASVVEAMGEAARAIEAGEPAAAVEPLSRTNLHLGLFLAGVSSSRRRALEALADAQSGSVGGSPALERSLESLRESSARLSRRDLAGALSAQRAAGRALAGALSALRAQLGVAGTPEADRRGTPGAIDESLADAWEAWDPRTRGEMFEVAEAIERREDMAYPRAYRDVVRLYLRLLRLEE